MKTISNEGTISNEDRERFEGYLHRNNWWFSSSPEMDLFTAEKVRKKELKPLHELVGDKAKNSTWIYAFVPFNFQIKDLPKIFKIDFLVDVFGLTVWDLPELTSDFSI